MSFEKMMPSNYLILCCPLLLLPSIFPSFRVFSNESVLCIRWPKYWSFNFSISPSTGYSGLISFRIDWFDLLAVQGTLKSLLQHCNSKAARSVKSSFGFSHDILQKPERTFWITQLSGLDEVTRVGPHDGISGPTRRVGGNRAHSPPCEDTERRSSARQQEGLQEWNLPATCVWTFQPPELREINMCYLSHPDCGTLLWQLQQPQFRQPSRHTHQHLSVLHLIHWRLCFYPSASAGDSQLPASPSHPPTLPHLCWISEFTERVHICDLSRCSKTNLWKRQHSDCYLNFTERLTEAWQEPVTAYDHTTQWGLGLHSRTLLSPASLSQTRTVDNVIMYHFTQEQVAWQLKADEEAVNSNE